MHLVIKETRLKKGLSQREVAKLIGVTQAAYSMYESGKQKIPDDILENLTDRLQDHRLKARYLFESRKGLFNVPLLDNVDDHVQVVLDCLVEESTELIDSASALKCLLKNKNSIDDLTEKEIEALHSHYEQIVDILPAVQLALIRSNEVFDINLQELEDKVYLKYKYKNYIQSKNRQKKRAMLVAEHSSM